MDQHTQHSIRNKIIAILSEISDISEEELINALIIHNLSLSETEIDSLNILEALFAINKEFGVRLPQNEWTEAYQNQHSRDSLGLRLYTLPSIVAEVHQQLAAKTEIVA